MVNIIPIDEAQVDMIIARDIVSSQGQVLAKRGTVLDEQLWMHLQFYGIDQIAVEPEDVPSAPILLDILDNSENTKESVVSGVRKKAIFKDFKQAYVNEVNNLKSSLSDFIKRREPMEKEALLKDTKELFAQVHDTSDIMMMLYNMRQIDDVTYAHSVNVSLVCRVIGTWLQYPEEDLDTLTLCGLLHDVGKSEIPMEIIKKPGPLTDDEFTVIQNHPVYGHKILKEQKVDKRVKLSALQHHERCNGRGYPYGLTIEELDSFSLIVAIADVYDAMTANRCYRDGLCPFDVIASMEDMGEGFHPYFLKIFLQNTASAYLGADAELTTGDTGRVHEINPDNVAYPKIQLKNGDIIDLSENRNIFIEKIF